MKKEELLKSAYGLNDVQVKILMILIKSGEKCSIRILQKRLKKDRTTIQKYVNKLLKKGLIEKRQINLNRGFCFYYQTPDKDKLLKSLDKQRERIKQGVDKAYCNIFDEVNKL